MTVLADTKMYVKIKNKIVEVDNIEHKVIFTTHCNVCNKKISKEYSYVPTFVGYARPGQTVVGDLTYNPTLKTGFLDYIRIEGWKSKTFVSWFKSVHVAICPDCPPKKENEIKKSDYL